jgi:FkbM family methyltransferase
VTSGGPLESGPWPIRIALTAGFRFCRLLDRLAPRLTDLVGTGIDTAGRCQQKIRTARTDVVTMRVGGTRFRLRLEGGHKKAHDMYFPLAVEGQAYEPLATACLTRLLQRLPQPTFMDIGAFVGYFTCFAAALLEDRQPVWAVESNPLFCETIRKTVALNGFTRVRVLQAILADRPRTMTIDDVSVLPSAHDGPRRRTVQAVTLDDLCARELIAPRIVKIDVHGAEGMVLRGMARLLRDSIQVILLELHALHEYQPHSPDITRVALLEWLEDCGFSVFHVAGHVWEHLSGLKTHLEQGRFAYVPVTAATRQQLLYDRPVEILIVASKIPDLSELLGPPVDLATAVG